MRKRERKRKGKEREKERTCTVIIIIITTSINFSTLMHSTNLYTSGRESILYAV